MKKHDESLTNIILMVVLLQGSAGFVLLVPLYHGGLALIGDLAIWHTIAVFVWLIAAIQVTIREVAVEKKRAVWIIGAAAPLYLVIIGFMEVIFKDFVADKAGGETVLDLVLSFGSWFVVAISILAAVYAIVTLVDCYRSDANRKQLGRW